MSANETKIIRPPRVFKIGSLVLADPNPDAPAEEAVRVYGSAYPQALAGHLEGPELEDGKLVYTVAKPPAKTFG